MKGINEDEIDSLIRYCEINGVKELKILDIIADLTDKTNDLYVDCNLLYQRSRFAQARYDIITQGGFGHPMRQYLFPSGLKVTVKDSKTGAWYHPSCSKCRSYPCHDALMALRLTSDSKLQYCLLNPDNIFEIKSSIEESIADALIFFNEAVFINIPKPVRHLPSASLITAASLGG